MLRASHIAALVAGAILAIAAPAGAGAAKPVPSLQPQATAKLWLKLVQRRHVAAGDTWAVNESSSAVRTGTGAARQNLRDLVRGLYDAGGTGPAVKGAVFAVGVSQAATNLTTYKGTLQQWYVDTAFWRDMAA